MKNRIKSMMWLLLLGIGTTALVQSCQKEPVDPCGETACTLTGYIAFEQNGCVTPPTGRIGIQGDDGNFYRINKDYTGRFTDYSVGTYVSFGLCCVKDVDPGDIYTPLIWAPPVKEANLGCIEEIRKPGDPEPCDQVAEVVGVSYQENGPQTDGPYLNINGNVYAVSGDLADEFQNYPIGTKLMVSASKAHDCYLPAVITYPNIVGCVELSCISPMPVFLD